MTTTDTTTPLTLGWGYRIHGLPATARAAFGARMIVRQSGSADFVPDRQTLVGRTEQDRLTFADTLDAGLLRAIRGRIEVLLSEWTMRTDRGEPFVLWQDDETGITAVADTNGSYGYCYLAVFVQ